MMLTVGAEDVSCRLIQDRSDFEGSDNRLGLSGAGLRVVGGVW